MNSKEQGKKMGKLLFSPTLLVSAKVSCFSRTGSCVMPVDSILFVFSGFSVPKLKPTAIIILTRTIMACYLGFPPKNLWSKLQTMFSAVPLHVFSPERTELTQSWQGEVWVHATPLYNGMFGLVASKQVNCIKCFATSCSTYQHS